ncbi:hypothetical protein HWC13_gp146 [Nodularia phage vB_NspS-kac68v161]|uniref:Uncharacterized protein n=1 Tax=Nodularia phage vB_NspS-kac68v161 TaxID=2557582 RepID=A0A482MJT6_9CAUD|nr:hypothetical protein HWC13_gp146 [Nodularia phage vB_NspS-kac68v161]QBQ73815.1 hypothetical protein kac68v161_gp165 [Nodularia phage vB_NspS-kac68v161]
MKATKIIVSVIENDVAGFTEEPKSDEGYTASMGI